MTDHAWNNVQTHCTKMHIILLYGKGYMIGHIKIPFQLVEYLQYQC